ncbi:unnamed protein product [Mytilus coruscus]|uniref:DZIP3-like HEPN domain-containing protein n=1 Tax=Mytilus coruscus TaxID=42192 RepID=A0A6J8BK07_MYTCO|nr:unnamed protein product [Mytilus coruscus]
MNTYTTSKVQELLLLLKCVVQTGNEVFSAFAIRKLRYKESFQQFLHDNKHEIFHLWQSKKLSCCACPAAGCNLKRMSLMSNLVFKQMYDDIGLQDDREHIVCISGNVEQECLHKYIIRDISIHDLDLSAISFLLRNFTRLSPNEIDALDTITNYRNQICQTFAMNDFTKEFLSKAWTDLESALVYLTDFTCKRHIMKQIQYLRTYSLEKEEEIKELLKNIVEVNNLSPELKTCYDKVIAVRAFTKKQNTDDNAGYPLQNSLHKSSRSLMELQQLHGNMTSEEKEAFLQKIEMSAKFEDLTNLLLTGKTRAVSEENAIHWRVPTPDDLDLTATVAILRKSPNKDVNYVNFKEKFLEEENPVSWNLIPPGGFRLGAGTVTFQNLSNSGERLMKKATKEDGTYPETFECDGLFIDCIVDSRLTEKPQDRTYPGTFECDGLFIDCIVDSRLTEKPKDGKTMITDAFKRILNKHLCTQKRYKTYKSLHDCFLYSMKRIDITTGKINAEMECRYILSHFNQNNNKYIESLHSGLKLAISHQCVNCAKAIAWKLTRLFAKTLPKKQVYGVWPGCVCNCKFKSKQDNLICALDIVIVVEVFNMNESFTRHNVFYDIPIIYKQVNGYSEEANLISKRIDQYQGVDDELKTVNVSNKQSQKLFTAHSKLCLITKSLIKSKGYGRQNQTLVKELCVQLFCRAKGIIPVGEAHFPTTIDLIATDVIEGYPQLLAKDVKIGSEVGASCCTGTGTLGGFVKFNGEDALLTCAHVVLGRDMLGPNANRSEIHMNPVVVYCKNPSEQEFQCGKLVYYVFPPEIIDGTSVDAAIIRMDLSTRISQIAVATDSEGHDLKSMYLNNNFVDYRSIGTSLELQVAAVWGGFPSSKTKRQNMLS